MRRAILQYRLHILGVGLVVLVSATNDRLLGFALPPIIQDTVTLSFGVFYEAFPFIVLGSLLSVLIGKYVSRDRLIRILPNRELPKNLTLSLTGFLLPVCECGNVPVARSLVSKGIRPSGAIAFLLAAPILNPITLLTTYHAFPNEPRLVVLRAFAALAIALGAAWVFFKWTAEKALTKEFDAYCKIHNHHDTKTTGKVHALKSIADNFSKELGTLLPSLAAGSLVAGLIQTIIPRSILLQLGSEPVVAVLVMIALAFLVSICANVDAFFALSLSGVFPLSAILAFLVFGPMIDIKMLALLRTTFSRRLLVRLCLFVFSTSLLVGLGGYYVL